MKRKADCTVHIEQHNSISESGVRTTGRVKKPKTVFDPSDNYISRAHRTAITNTIPEQTSASAPVSGSVNNSLCYNSTANDANNNYQSNLSTNKEMPVLDYGKGFDTCSKCLKTEPKRGQGFKSKFLQCRGCTQKWHINCMKIQFECYRLARDKYKCEKCRTCTVCKRNKITQSPKNKELVMCTLCVDVYHVDCHSPSINKSQIIDGAFKCSTCEYIPPDNVGPKFKKDFKKRSITPDARSSLKPSSSSSSLPETSSQEIKETEQELLTDTASISKWSIDDVVNFFSKYHPNEAHIFQDHEVDGVALLLLERKQLIQRFNLTLGKALRIYETVVALQTQNDSIMMTWFD